MININISSLQVLKYISGEPGYKVVPSQAEPATISDILPGEYKVSLKVEANQSFDAVGFNLTWETPQTPGPSFEIVSDESNPALVKKEDGDLFEGLPKDLVVNPFLGENPKRIYITKALTTTALIAPGTYTIVSIFFKVEIIENLVRVFISISHTPVSS